MGNFLDFDWSRLNVTPIHSRHLLVVHGPYPPVMSLALVLLTTYDLYPFVANLALVTSLFPADEVKTNMDTVRLASRTCRS